MIWSFTGFETLTWPNADCAVRSSAARAMRIPHAGFLDLMIASLTMDD
jgi:hypothetical protein